MKARFAVLALLAAAPLAAQAPPVTKTEAVEITTTIEAIDHTARLVTLKDEQGASETIYAPPELKRFNELKVGDKVTFKYSESIAYQIRKAGAAAGAPADKQPTLERGTGPKPSGTISQQKTAVVTVKTVDAKTPSVTVVTADGNVVSFKVDDVKNLTGVSPGDKVEITYTQAVLIAVK
jgi:hypothetical protein